MMDQIIQEHYKKTPIFYTDKSTLHCYDRIYDQILESYRDKDGSLLEIGVYYGGSLLLWQEYFTKMSITGIDVENNVPESIFTLYDIDRVQYYLRDAYSDETVNMLKQKKPEGYDIIIDDGPHDEESQLKFIDNYLRMVRKGGLLIIEDILNFDTIDRLVEKVHTIFDPEAGSDYYVNVYDCRGSRKKRYDDLMLVVEVLS